MTALELEQELKKLDSRFSVAVNESRPGLSNIFFEGKNYDLPAVSTDNIKDEIDMNYRYEFPNGMLARYWSKPEIMGRIEDFLNKYNQGTFGKLYED